MFLSFLFWQIFTLLETRKFGNFFVKCVNFKTLLLKLKKIFKLSKIIKFIKTESSIRNLKEIIPITKFDPDIHLIE
jgi:hypothetical protein